MILVVLIFVEIRKMNVNKMKKGLALRSKATKGFTLIELLVVIAILGLLATIGIGSFQSSQIKGRDAQRKHDLGQIQKALEMYYNDYKAYPDAINFGATWEDAQGTIYIKTVPNDPKGGNYCYESDANGSYYKLYAKLENSQDPKIITPDSSVCPASAGYNYGVSSSNTKP